MLTKLSPSLSLSLPFTMVLLVAATVGGLARPASAQPAVTPEVASSVISESTSGSARRLEWLRSTPEQRMILAERVGEEGAREFARAKGWKPLVDGTKSTLRQGFDQVYRTADDMLIVVEAKGGGSPLGKAYGYPQGSPEWAVKASERTIKSLRSSAAEKEAAKAVLKAAREGRLKTTVIRTRHRLGEPTAAILESMSSATDDAARLAGQSLDDLVARGLMSADEAAAASDDALRVVAESADDAAKASRYAKAARVAAKAAVPVAVGVDVGLRAHEAVAVEKQFEAGEITQQERELAHAQNAAGPIGGWGGAFVGFKVGALCGGAAGSFAPGPGTAIGASVGGLAGGIAGYIGGEAAAEAAAEWAVSKVHSTGQTLRSVASDTVDAMGDAADAVGKAASDAWHWTSGTFSDGWKWAFGD